MRAFQRVGTTALAAVRFESQLQRVSSSVSSMNVESEDDLAPALEGLTQQIAKQELVPFMFIFQDTPQLGR